MHTPTATAAPQRGSTTTTAPFEGTEAERTANRESHQWDMSDPDTRCWRCDSRPSHRAANYPCGATVPRVTVFHDA